MGKEVETKASTSTLVGFAQGIEVDILLFFMMNKKQKIGTESPLVRPK